MGSRELLNVSFFSFMLIEVIVSQGLSQTGQTEESEVRVSECFELQELETVERYSLSTFITVYSVSGSSRVRMRTSIMSWTSLGSD